jgi:hypothetical protein
VRTQVPVAGITSGYSERLRRLSSVFLKPSQSLYVGMTTWIFRGSTGFERNVAFEACAGGIS